MWRLGHRPALDGLRGIAILLVLVAHVEHRFAAAGPVGVTVFFVLSGFLITSLLLEEYERTGDIGFRAFYLRRARRLFPALAVLLVVIGVTQWLVYGFGPITLLPVVLYCGNWVAIVANANGMFKHTWSLAVEEQFYLLWPLLMIFAARLGGKRAVMWTALAGAAVSVVLRFVLWDGGAGAARVRFGSDTNAAGLLIGCALAVWMSSRTPGVNRPYVASTAVGLAALLGAFSSSINYTLFAPVVAMVASAAAIFWLCQDGSVGAFGNPFLRFAGRRSYGWYLWQSPLLLLAVRFDGSLTSRLVAVLAAVGVAEASWRLFEKPFLRKRLNRRLVPVAGSRPVDRRDRRAVPPARVPDYSAL